MDAMTSHDKLLAALAILQSEILARDSSQSPKMFGNMYMPTSHLELAERMLNDCVGDLEYTMSGGSASPAKEAAA